ncbi:MAG: hypothetical protein WBL02_09740 [Methanomethylovorans sp.]|uniref:hypothetical protein n=1 Tax=Methanomethylovorans sp. TaxID=2758717 RepID=UPI000B0E8FEA|nr:hypothetical protein [Methanomethylovorans sp.]
MLLDQIEKELDLSERHLVVLKTVMEKGPIGILKLAEETGMPTHKVRYSLRVLEQEQLIKPSMQGAIAGPAVEKFQKDFEKDMARLQEMIASVFRIGRSI